MQDETEIVVPTEVPMMTLPRAVFFPQALMPLHIFEPRYRQMLRDVLAADRVFGVAAIDLRAAEREPERFEPPHRIASLGIVRACQKNDDGTANLLLQGLCRVRVEGILQEEPYRRVRVVALSSKAGADEDSNQLLCQRLGRLLRAKHRLGGHVSTEFARFLGTVTDPETYVDLTAFSLCDDADVKQRLLETLDVNRRLRLLVDHVRGEVEHLRLRHHLQGRLSDDDIGNN